MSNHFEILGAELCVIKKYVPTSSVESYFVSEVLRFYSIAGTVQNFPNPKQNIDSRIITHILARSLFENYFWLLYIFNDPTTINQRFDELLNGFKIEYNKLYKEPLLLPYKDQLEAPDASWASLTKPKDINSMLASLKNDDGDRLKELYFIYRVTSFDTHGKSLKPLFDESFKKDCNFPVLDLEKAFDLIANHYLMIWQAIHSKR